MKTHLVNTQNRSKTSEKKENSIFEIISKTSLERIATGKDRIMGYRPGPGWNFKILF